MRTLTITDANIFIDLFELELTSFLFQLNLTVHTTREVLLECDPENLTKLEEYAQNELLKIHILSDLIWEEMETLNFNKGLSDPDRSILYVAFEKKGMVLTGDNLVRKWCVRNNLEVHGILWVLNEFAENELIDFETAILKLEYLMKVNSWLPMKACEELLENWQKK